MATTYKNTTPNPGLYLNLYNGRIYAARKMKNGAAENTKTQKTPDWVFEKRKRG